LWSFETGGTIRSSPAIAPMWPNASNAEILYIGSNDDRLYSLTACCGTLRWSVETGGNIQGRPLVNSLSGNGTVYVRSHRHASAYMHTISAKVMCLRRLTALEEC
jgi:outer membrane protein assembly factor BamB